MSLSRKIGLGCCALLCLGASAQLPTGFKLPSLWYNPALLIDPNVQKELHISSEAANRAIGVMLRVAMKIQPAIRTTKNGNPPTPDQVKAASAALVEMQNACIKGMTSAQKERFHEITLQSLGPKALLDRRVGLQLGLTDSEASRLQAALLKTDAASGPRGVTASNLGVLQASVQASRRRSESALSAILTPRQSLKWKAMQGKPIKLSPLSSLIGG